MKRTILFVFGFILLFAGCTKQEDKPTSFKLKVGTYNLWTSDSRKDLLTPLSSRYWSNSSPAMLSIIKDMNCDIFAFQEICDSIYGKKGESNSLRYLMQQENMDYSWAIWSNVDGSYVTPTSGRISYSPGICYKASVLTLEEGGVFWLGGNPNQPEFVGFTPEHGDCKRACVWARMRHKATNKEFYFFSTHLEVTSFKGVDDPEVNTENCKNLMNYADETLVGPGVPAIICGDMNAKPTDQGYIQYLNNSNGRVHQWFNAYEEAERKGVLGPMAKEGPGTMNNHNTEATGTYRIDHMFLTGFTLTSYETVRKKFPTKDGSLHYPSDHFPLVVTVEF
ncbi:MAG: endonuclease/exonuclease/phosphatase family protein [Bacteroidales bacterium]|nr:endonuclease/exonuclease/phosphatase family protein [Bacteroidales bacterium]